MKPYGFVAACLLAFSAHAGGDGRAKSGIDFQHGDWEVACDNTGTCRAAGYQADADERAVSVLLTRKAGPNQAVSGQIMLGAYDEESVAMMAKLPDPVVLQMRIDDTSSGIMSVGKQTAIAKLSAKQVAALLASLSATSDIEFVAGDNSWHLSDVGATSVLLKMDDFQGRIGTRGALTKKGPLDEQHVVLARAAPVVHAAKFQEGETKPSPWLVQNAAALQSALLKTTGTEDCQNLTGAEPADLLFQAARLDDQRSLVSFECWRAAYNEGIGFWVINTKPPFDPVLVTTMGSEYSAGGISSNQRQRGLGDCWSVDTWVWDGRRFVPTASSSTGMCKLIAPGGTWELPTLVSEIR